MKNHSNFTKKKIDVFKNIYIQEYLKGKRPELIIKAISERYLIPEQTIRGLIKPSKLKAEIKDGKHNIDNSYKSIVSC